MPVERIDLQNAFETTLTTQMGATDLTALVASVGALSSPCVLVIDPGDDAKREYILFDGTFGGTSFVTTAIGNRYLEGSAAGSGIVHLATAVVASVMTSQYVNDLYDEIDASNAVVAALDHGADLAGLGDDDHTQYHTDARGDARYLGITAKAADSDLLDNHDTAYFATKSEFDAHDGGIDVADHPEATASARGFMSAAAMTKLDGIEASAKNDQTITAGAGLAGGGSGNPTLTHADTSTQASVNNAIGTVIEDVTLDTYGHITALGSRNLAPADIGAQPTITNERAVGVTGGTVGPAAIGGLTSSYSTMISTAVSKPSGWGSALVIAWGTAQWARSNGSTLVQANAKIVIDTSSGSSDQSGANPTDGGPLIVNPVHSFVTSESTINISLQAYWTLASGSVGKKGSISYLLIRAS